MRIHLRLEGFQFRVAGQHARLNLALLSLPRGLDGQEHVVQAHGKQVNHHAACKQERVIGRKALLDPAEHFEACERASHPARDEDPDAADDNRRCQVRQSQPRKTRGGEGSPSAGVPCRQAHKGVEQAQGQDEDECLRPAEASGESQDVEENRRQRNPGEKVKPQLPEVAKNGVHRRSVADFNSAEHCDAADV